MCINHEFIHLKLTKKLKELGYNVTFIKKVNKRYMKYTSVYMDDLFYMFPNSQTKVKGVCDECGEKFERQICTIYKFDDHVIRCRKCTHKKLYSNENFVNNMIKKMKETNLKKYGCEIPSQSEQIKNKMKQTCLDRYGVEWASQLPETVEKMKQTCLDRYGTEWSNQNDEVKQKIKQTQFDRYGMLYSQTEECKEKRKQTSLEKYGVEYYMQTNEFKERVCQTSLKHFGVEHPLSSEEVKQKRYETNIKKYGYKNAIQNNKTKEKMLHSLLDNNPYGVKSSKEQKYLNNLFGGRFNYPVKHFVLDIAFIDEMINVEYNGGGHNLDVKVFNSMTQEEFDLREKERYDLLNDLGWKIIVFISETDCLPNDKLLLQLFEKSKIIDSKLIKIYLDKEIVECNSIYTFQEFLK